MYGRPPPAAAHLDDRVGRSASTGSAPSGALLLLDVEALAESRQLEATHLLGLVARLDPPGQGAARGGRHEDAGAEMARRRPRVGQPGHAVDDRELVRMGGAQAAPCVRDACLT